MPVECSKRILCDIGNEGTISRSSDKGIKTPFSRTGNTTGNNYISCVNNILIYIIYDINQYRQSETENIV